MISLLLPIVFFIGPLRMAPYRLILILTFAPLFISFLTGAYGKLNSIDFFVLFFGSWVVVSLMVNHGIVDKLEYSGIQFVEIIGSFLLGRCCIRGPKGFGQFLRIFGVAVLVMLPFLMIEAVTGRRLISDAFRGAFAVYGTSHAELRWGMSRAQGPFEHPILLGVFCSVGFAWSYYAKGATKTLFSGAPGAALFAAGTFFSLSMGAYLSLMFQGGLVAFDKITGAIRGKWWILLAGSIAAYLFVDLLSNRTPITILINTLSFNSIASFMRLAVWEYATDVVMDNPVFGVGLKDWPRPGWVTGSIDNFWLVNALRHGLPGVAAITACVYLLIRRIGAANLSDPSLSAQRKGYLIGLVGICIALGTVHVWNAMFAFLMFYIGAGIWMLQGETQEGPSLESGQDGPDRVKSRPRSELGYSALDAQRMRRR